MNDQHSAKSALIITTAFSPENAVGAIRLTKVAKYLVRLDYAVTVISPQLGTGNKIDLSLECDELKRVERIQIGHGPLFARLFLKQRNRLIAQKSASEFIQDRASDSLSTRIKVHVFRLGQFLYTLLRAFDWRAQVIRYLKQGCRKNQFDVVLSSYPSLGAPWAAAFARRQGIARRWVTDFRDPLCYEENSNRLIYFVNARMQDILMGRADAVTYVSRGMAAKFNVADPTKLHYIPNGYDPDDLIRADCASAEGCEDNKTLALCYVGSLYGGARDLSVVFAALRDLMAEGRIPDDGVRVGYAGNDGAILKAQAAKSGLERIVCDYGYVGRSESLDLQAASDIIIVATWNTALDQGVVPGKLYECFLLRKPILGIVAGEFPGSEMAEMIRYVGGGIAFEEAVPHALTEFGRLKEFLDTSYCERRQDGNRSSDYNDRVTQFSYREIAARFDEIFFQNSKSCES